MSMLSAETDERFMRRAIRLAMNGRGRVEPNPMVGCVIVNRDGRMIGEGHHAQFGGPHAEPAALANCTEPPAGATAYVTLEPCCHTKKKTPPCAPRLIQARLARVVIGCLDPNPDVNGKGVAMLRSAGIRVDGPVLEGETKQLIEPFLRRVESANPYVTLKWAESADGKVAGPGGRRTQLSGAEASELVHRLRARCDAIVVGINTVLNDDPLLTPRGVDLRHRPTRIVLDRRLRLPLRSQLVRTAREWPTVVISDHVAGPLVSQLKERGVRLYAHSVQGTDDDEDLDIAVHGVMRDELQLGEVLVEAGPTLASRFFSYRGHYTLEELGKTPISIPIRSVDRLWVIRSPIVIADPTAPSAPRIPNWIVQTGTVRIGADTLTEYRSPMRVSDESEESFAPVPSADFVLASESANQ